MSPRSTRRPSSVRISRSRSSPSRPIRPPDCNCLSTPRHSAGVRSLPAPKVLSPSWPCRWTASVALPDRIFARWPKKNRPEVRKIADIAFCASTRPSISRTAPWQTSQCPHGRESSPNMARSVWRRQRAVSQSATSVVELGHLDALALLGRPVVENLAPPELDVARAIQRERVGGQAVAAGAADLLVISLDR